MKLFNKDIYLIDPDVLENSLRQPPINPEIFLNGVKSQSIKGSIVLTIEEARELFNAGREKGWEVTVPTDDDEAPDFETYLTLKGIDIP